MELQVDKAGERERGKVTGRAEVGGKQNDRGRDSEGMLT